MIGSEDPKRLVDYYTKILGKPAMSEGGYDGWQIGSGWITVGPHDEVKGKNPTPGRLILNIESEDVKGDFEKSGLQAPKSFASHTTSERSRPIGSRPSPIPTITTSSS